MIIFVLIRKLITRFKALVYFPLLVYFSQLYYHLKHHTFQDVHISFSTHALGKFFVGCNYRFSKNTFQRIKNEN